MNKIKKLSIANILESVVLESTEGGSKIISASLGASIELKKDDGTSSLFIAVSAAGPSKYKKVEDKDLEFPILHNELAGVVGDFDSKVQALMQSYGYEWVNPVESKESGEGGEGGEGNDLLESIKESSGNPLGAWVGDFFVTGVISLSKMVDAAVENYSFDDQGVENKFRAKFTELLKENDDTLSEQLVGSDSAADNMVEEMRIFIEFHEDELSEFADYK